MTFVIGPKSDSTVSLAWERIRTAKQHKHQASTGMLAPPSFTWYELQRLCSSSSKTISDELRDRLTESCMSQPLITDALLLKEISNTLSDDDGYLKSEFTHYHTEKLNIKITDLNGLEDRYLKWTKDALEHLSTCAPRIYAIFNSIVSTIIPISHKRNGVPHRRGMTTLSAPCAIFTTFNDRKPEVAPYDLAIDIAHEVGHLSLCAFQFADKIMLSSHTKPIYSAVRKVERPAIQSLHALIALSFMIEFTENAIRADLDENESKFLNRKHKSMVDDLISGVTSLESEVKFTELGSKIFKEIQHHAKSLHL